MERVVITGIGTINPLANNSIDTWKRALSNTVSCDNISRFDAGNLQTQIACEIKAYDPLSFLDKKDINRLDRVSQYALIAANEAIEMSSLSQKENKERIGVIWATGNGGAETYDQTLKDIFVDNRRVSPYFIPKILLDTSSGIISIKHGLKGVNYTTVAACASGSTAIADAFNYIRWGKAEAIVTGGSDAPICESIVRGFNALKALSTNNENPRQAIRPFDIGRNGFVLGEGGAALVLESYTSAKERGANIIAEVVGTGINADAYHMTAGHPEGQGAAACIKLALDEAGVSFKDLDYVNAHATSTKVGDMAEANALASFGKLESAPMVGATKSMTGHLMGAAGAIEGIFCALAVQNNALPPNVNLEQIDTDIPQQINFIGSNKIEMNVNYALSNNFGFGGHNSSVLFKKYIE